MVQVTVFFQFYVVYGNSCNLSLAIYRIQGVCKFSNYFRHYYCNFDASKTEDISCKDSCVAVEECLSTPATYLIFI